MFLRFTKKFSRPKLGFIIALLMLFAPVFIVTTVESAQRNKAKTKRIPPGRRNDKKSGDLQTSESLFSPTNRRSPHFCR